MRRAVVTVLTLAVLAAAMAVQTRIPETVLAEAPERHLGDLEGCTGERLEPGEVELSALPSDTAFEKRRYTDAAGHEHLVTLVVGGRSRASIHRPELCLPSQGFLMTRPHALSVGGTEWRAIVLDGGVGRPSCGFAYTFFNQDGFRTSSHVRRIFRDVWDRTFHGRIDRWVMVTVFSTASDDAALGAFLAKLKEVTE